MLFVVDASSTLAWLFGDVVNPSEERLLGSLVESSRARVPSVWSYEVANGLRQLRRAGRLTQQESEAAFQRLRQLPIEVEREPLAWLFHAVGALADEQDLTIYDAAYLELARRDRLPLATRDKKLRSAARAIGVDVVV